MKKFWITLISLIGALILLVILSYIYIATIIGSILTSSLGTDTSVDNAALSTHFLKLWHIKVTNPPNTKEPYALRIGRLRVNAPINTYFSNDIEIDLISLDDLTLVLEYLPGNNKLTNWDEIINHINKVEPKKDPKNPKNTTIKTLTINNIKVRIVSPDGTVEIKTIKNLTFHNLSTKDGNITAQIAKTITMKLLFNISNLVKFPIKLPTNITKDTIKDGAKTLEKIFHPQS